MHTSDHTHYTHKRPARFSLRRCITVILCLLTATAIMLSFTQCKNNKDTSSSVSDTSSGADSGGEGSSDASASYDALTFLTPEIPDDGTDGYYDDYNYVYVYNKMAFELCGANDEAGETYADAVSRLKAAVPDVTVYNMVIPTHVEFGLPTRLSDGMSSSQSKNIKLIYSSYSEDVQPINCYNALCEHKDEYVYFNTDHHWTGLGAYYAYEAFCEQTGQAALQLSDCTEMKIEGFEGTFIDSDASLSQNIDTVYYWELPYSTHAKMQYESGGEMYDASIYMEGMGSGSATYSTFIGGDYPLFIEYNDDNKNGRKIAVLKDSFGNAFVPYLSYNYEEVHVIDPRYFGQDLTDYLKENGITEVLITNNIMSANNPSTAYSILDLIS